VTGARPVCTQPENELAPPFWLAFGFSLVAAAVSLGGLLAVRRFDAWGRANSVLFAAFAAGVLIAASLVKLVPEAIEAAPAAAPFWLLGGYLFLYALGQIMGRGEATSHEERRAVALIPVLGIALHSTIDGIIYSVAFSVDIFTGVMAVFGLVLHELPEGIVAYILLLRGGFARNRAFLLAFLASAATTPFGMLLSYPLVEDLEGVPLGVVLAAVAGALIYVSASHLVPHIEHESGRGRSRAFAAGLAVALLVILTHAP